MVVAQIVQNHLERPWLRQRGQAFDEYRGDPDRQAFCVGPEQAPYGEPWRHWDHLGGIRSAIDEGATIVTHQTNKAFLERVAKTPHTLNPDRLSMSKKAVKIQTVGDMAKLTDGTRTIELYNLTGYEHTRDMLVVYLPKEKILAEPDAFSPPATPTTPLAASAVPYAAALYDNIQRRKLDVKTIAPFHGGRMTDVPELAKAGAVNLRADFIYRTYDPLEVRKRWRLLRAGKVVPGGHAANFDRGML